MSKTKKTKKNKSPPRAREATLMTEVGAALQEESRRVAARITGGVPGASLTPIQIAGLSHITGIEKAMTALAKILVQWRSLPAEMQCQRGCDALRLLSLCQASLYALGNLYPDIATEESLTDLSELAGVFIDLIRRIPAHTHPSSPSTLH